MFLDLVSGETYGDTLGNDGKTVVLWTQGRESVIPWRTWTQGVDLVSAEGVAWARIARFHEVSDPSPSPADLEAVAARRAQLAAYAFANGGQHTEHLAPAAEPSRLAAVARFFGLTGRRG